MNELINKLDGVGPVGTRPFTYLLQQIYIYIFFFLQATRDMTYVTRAMCQTTLDMCHVTHMGW